MERRLDQDLDRLRHSLLRMAGMVESMVAKATRALLERSAALCAEVIANDHTVDQLEMEIDDFCHSILGRRQPTAVDLRFLVAVMKINSDLQRNRDTEQATSVLASDDEVDGLYKQIFRELLTYMIEDPRTVTRALHLLLTSRNLERTADHATNIAEDVIYYVEGRDVRHSISKV